MTLKKLTERQIKWSLILFKYDFMINYITGRNNERVDVFLKREQNIPEIGDDILEYKMAQLLKPRMLNFKKVEIDQSETSTDSPQLGDFIKIQPVATEENGAEFQPITIQEPENELENLWATAKSNITIFTNRWWVRSKKENEYCLPFWFSKFLSVIVR